MHSIIATCTTYVISLEEKKGPQNLMFTVYKKSCKIRPNSTILVTHSMPQISLIGIN